MTGDDSAPVLRALAFFGGGTGGHVFPGIAVAERAQERFPGCRAVFFRTARAVEEKVFEGRGLETRTLAIRPPGRSAGGWVRYAREAARAMREARAFLAGGCDAAFGLGGYASLPGILAARAEGVPVILLEQNRVAGKVTRLLAPFAAAVSCAFEGMSLPFGARAEGQNVGMWLENEGKVVLQSNIVVNSGSCGTANCAGIFLPEHGTTDDRTFYSILNNTLDVANRPCLRASMQGLADAAHPSTNAQVRLQVFNNVFQAGGAGVCVQIPDYGHTFACNNNCFYRVGGSAVCGKVGSQSFTTLASWRSVIYGEKNSIESVPGFVGGGNYHLASAPLSACVNRGTEEIYDPVGAPFDMDGGPRVKAISIVGENPRMLFVGRDIGADELGAENVGRAFKRGDADNSGTVDFNDSGFLLNYLFSGGAAPVCMDAADATDDEAVDISDGTFILNMLFDHSAFSFPKLFSFPEPSPECGFDLVQQSTPGLTCTTPTWCDP